jgi:hypothetical protein
MAELRRGDDGVWTLHRGDSDLGERNAVHDEALPRYVTALDRVFTRAEEACESEFVKALIRVGSAQDPGWDPYESTLRAIPAMIALHEELPEGSAHFETARHLQLWTYGHIIEASEPYAILADMLDIANGGFFKPFRFPPVPINRAGRNQPAGPTRPQFFREKLSELERLANEAQEPGILDPIHEIWDYDLRNAVFHADYSLHGAEVRIPRRAAYTHEEIMALVNSAIAYHEALAVLIRGHRRGYDEPKRVLVHPEIATQPGEAMFVMIREGDGAIGLRYVFTAEEVAGGAIPAYLARLYPDELAAVQADTTLVRLPARPVLRPAPTSRLNRLVTMALKPLTCTRRLVR